MKDMYGFVSAGVAPSLWGGYSTHQYLSADAMLLPVPASLDPVVATLFNPLGAGIRWGVTIPGTGPDDVLAILGPGIRGLSVLIAAKEAGASFAMVTGHGIKDAQRLEVAKRFGADLVVDVAEEDPAKALKAATGGLASIVVDVTANAPKALSQAVKCCRPGGTVVLAGIRGGDETPGFFPDHVVSKEIRIQGAFGVDTASYVRAIDILAGGKYPFADLPRRIASLESASSLIECMAGETGESVPIHGVVQPL
jgi:alcohol dehydrogenase